MEDLLRSFPPCNQSNWENISNATPNLYVKDIITYVQSTWSIVYSVPGMRNWLQRHGFSYQKKTPLSYLEKPIKSNNENGWQNTKS